MKKAGPEGHPLCSGVRSTLPPLEPEPLGVLLVLLLDPTHQVVPTRRGLGRATLVGIFPAPRGSYFTVAIGGWAALVAVLLVLTRSRLGYQEGTYDTDEASAPRVR